MKLLKMLAMCAVLLGVMCYPFHTYEKQDITVAVQAGDTVWGIAESYFDKQDKCRTMDEFLWEIKEANKGKFKTWGLVSVGDELIIPLYVREK